MRALVRCFSCCSFEGLHRPTVLKRSGSGFCPFYGTPPEIVSLSIVGTWLFLPCVLVEPMTVGKYERLAVVFLALAGVAWLASFVFPFTILNKISGGNLSILLLLILVGVVIYVVIGLLFRHYFPRMLEREEKKYLYSRSG